MFSLLHKELLVEGEPLEEVECGDHQDQEKHLDRGGDPPDAGGKHQREDGGEGHEMEQLAEYVIRHLGGEAHYDQHRGQRHDVADVDAEHLQVLQQKGGIHPIQMIDGNHREAEDEEDGTRHVAHGLSLDLIGESRADQGKQRGQHDRDQEEIPAFQDDGRLDEDMADRGDEGREGHDEGGGANRGLAVIAQHGGKHDQHHHTSARTEEAGAKTDGQSKEQGDRDLLEGQLDLPVLFGAFLGVGLDQKTDADGYAQKERKAAEHGLVGEVSGDRAHRTHTDDTRGDQPSVL